MKKEMEFLVKSVALNVYVENEYIDFDMEEMTLDKITLNDDIESYQSEMDEIERDKPESVIKFRNFKLKAWVAYINLIYLEIQYNDGKTEKMFIEL